MPVSCPADSAGSRLSTAALISDQSSRAGAPVLAVRAARRAVALQRTTTLAGSSRAGDPDALAQARERLGPAAMITPMQPQRCAYTGLRDHHVCACRAHPPGPDGVCLCQALILKPDSVFPSPILAQV